MTAATATAWALACALVPIVICIFAGAAIGRGQSRLPGADVLVGFGLIGCTFTVVAVTTRLPLSRLMLGLAILSLFAPCFGGNGPAGVPPCSPSR